MLHALGYGVGRLRVDTVDRYVLKGLAGPFTLCIAGFLIIALSGQLYNLISLIIEREVPAGDVARLLAYRLPELLTTAVPVGILFAVLVELGRMARDSELTVVQVAGRSLARVSTPLLFLGLLTSGLVYVLNEYVVPEANHRSQQIVRGHILRDVMRPAEQEVFFRGTENRYFYLGYVDKSSMRVQDVLVFELRGSRPAKVIFAQHGVMGPLFWELNDGVVQEMDSEGITISQTRFDTMAYKVEDQIGRFVGEQRTTDEMSRSDIREIVEMYRSSGVDLRSFVVAYEFKLSLPFAAAVFVLVGTGCSLGARKNGRFFSVAASIVLAFAYYLVSGLLRSFGNQGFLSPVVSAWAANAIFCALGVGLIARGDKVI
jgi:lipopolysaccharide export system permease protein